MACQLCYFLCCKARCSPRAVASALAFFPPTPPGYTLEDIPGECERLLAGGSTKYLRVEFAAVAGASGISFPKSGFACIVIKPRRGGHFPVVQYRYPGALVTVLFAHGNATDLGLMRDVLIDLCVNARVNVCAFDYRGYGPLGAADNPNDSACCSNIEAVYQFLLSSPDPAWRVAGPHAIVVYGQSVGSGPACWLASRYPVRGVILHSPITSGLRVITTNRCLACCDIFPNIERVPRIARRACGLLVVHGERDVEVPVHHGRALEAAFTRSAQARGLSAGATVVQGWYPTGAGHNDVIEKHRLQYYETVRRFLLALVDAGAPLSHSPPPATPAVPCMHVHTIGGGVFEVALNASCEDLRGFSEGATRDARAACLAPVVRPSELSATAARLWVGRAAEGSSHLVGAIGVVTASLRGYSANPAARLQLRPATAASSFDVAVSAPKQDAAVVWVPSRGSNEEPLRGASSGCSRSQPAGAGKDAGSAGVIAAGKVPEAAGASNLEAL